MWNPFRRKCKHKNFEAVESFVCRTDLFYHRIVIGKCMKCGRYGQYSSYAFIRGSGALDLYIPKHKDYVAHGDNLNVLSDKQYIQQVENLFEKYIKLNGKKILKFKPC